MASKIGYSLTRAGPEDIPEIVAVAWECFPPFEKEIFMGCKTKDEFPRTTAKWLKEMTEDPSDIWIKITDSANNKIIAASNWKLHLNGCNYDEHHEQPPGWLDGQILAQSKKVLDGMHEIRSKCMPGPFLHLHICFTDPAYRRKGAGRMMLQWGCDLADQLFLPGWIEASVEGNLLYKSAPFHFYDLASMAGELGGTVMRRDAKANPVVGGK